MASRVDTPQQGILLPQAKPLAAATPMRTPVKEPGPSATAMAASLGAYQGTVCPVMDARRSQVYNALFAADCGTYTIILEDRAISLQELGEELQNMPKPVFLVGDGSKLCYNTLLEKVPGLVLPAEHRMHQRAVGVALCALEKIIREEPGSGADLTPNYLRLSQAEREKLERAKG